jgi:hypothetical protein
MKIQKIEFTNEMFNEFALSNEEMICVRGGDGDGIIVRTNEPPIKI